MLIDKCYLWYAFNDTDIASEASGNTNEHIPDPDPCSRTLGILGRLNSLDVIKIHLQIPNKVPTLKKY